MKQQATYPEIMQEVLSNLGGALALADADKPFVSALMSQISQHLDQKRQAQMQQAQQAQQSALSQVGGAKAPLTPGNMPNMVRPPVGQQPPGQPGQQVANPGGGQVPLPGQTPGMKISPDQLQRAVGI